MRAGAGTGAGVMRVPSRYTSNPATPSSDAVRQRRSTAPPERRAVNACTTTAVGAVMFCGAGAAVEKSAELSSESVIPFPARWSESVLLGAGAAAGPSKQLAVPP